MRSVILSAKTFRDLQDKIAAIKAVRFLIGADLKEAKRLVEAVGPGHTEELRIPHTVMEPGLSENLRKLQDSGLTVTVTQKHDKIRSHIREEIGKLCNYCTLASQYDISRALLDVMETYCPKTDITFEEEEEDVD